jgi:hypothetical protein
MVMHRQWKEWGETVAPAALAVLALGLDFAGDGESFVDAAALGLVALAAALSGAAAVMSLGRFGQSPLGRRFSLWRACGLAAAAGCFGLELVERYGAPPLAADVTLQLTVLGGAWALLTGWVWDAGAGSGWPQGLPSRRRRPGGEAQRSVRWAGRKIGEA